MSARRVTDRPDGVSVWRGRRRLPCDPKRFGELVLLALLLFGVVAGYLVS